MLSKINLYYHTLKYLKWEQIKYQIYYRVRNALIGRGDYSDFIKKMSPEVQLLKFQDSIYSNTSFTAPKVFTFLNLSHSFNDNIDWNFSDYGKLWTYNLNYFEFLLQEKISKDEGLQLINDFIRNINIVNDGLAPYPISLRAVFWIRFILKHDIQDEQIDQSLFAQLQILNRNIEYHLLGNHLLENGFALLFGACYFNHQPFYKKAKQILVEELEEQILNDGGHFELSPMYHQIILYRLLDALNLVKNNLSLFDGELVDLLINKSSQMLSWLRIMTFKNGDIPLLNDSANGIAPKSNQLFEYASNLKLKPHSVPLKESGYRFIRKPNYECIVDVGPIGPDYIPGHAHSDTLNFCLYINDQPLIIDTGISTYEKNERRQLERSTASHNTVKIGELEQSEVWGGFRVARRANAEILIESENEIMASHDGYRYKGVNVERSFLFYEDKIVIEDKVLDNQVFKSLSYLHFHPSANVELSKDILNTSSGVIKFEGAKNIEKSLFEYAPQFNKTIHSNKISITFEGHLKMIISI